MRTSTVEAQSTSRGRSDFSTTTQCGTATILRAGPRRKPTLYPSSRLPIRRILLDLMRYRVMRINSFGVGFEVAPVLRRLADPFLFFLQPTLIHYPSTILTPSLASRDHPPPICELLPYRKCLVPLTAPLNFPRAPSELH